LNDVQGKTGEKRAPGEKEDPHPDSASSPVARDLWGTFELIIKESGYEESDGKGTPLALYPRSHHPSLALLACLACSRVTHLALGESLWRRQIKASFTGQEDKTRQTKIRSFRHSLFSIQYTIKILLHVYIYIPKTVNLDICISLYNSCNTSKIFVVFAFFSYFQSFN